MVLRLRANDFLRLTCAAGNWIEVRSGRVWVTETGTSRDTVLGPGRRYRVGGDGLVLIGAETCSDRSAGDAPGAEIALR